MDAPKTSFCSCVFLVALATLTRDGLAQPGPQTKPASAKSGDGSPPPGKAGDGKGDVKDPDMKGDGKTPDERKPIPLLPHKVPLVLRKNPDGKPPDEKPDEKPDDRKGRLLGPRRAEPSQAELIRRLKEAPEGSLRAGFDLSSLSLPAGFEASPLTAVVDVRSDAKDAARPRLLMGPLVRTLMSKDGKHAMRLELHVERTRARATQRLEQWLVNRLQHGHVRELDWGKDPRDPRSRPLSPWDIAFAFQGDAGTPVDRPGVTPRPLVAVIFKVGNIAARVVTTAGVPTSRSFVADLPNPVEQLARDLVTAIRKGHALPDAETTLPPVPVPELALAKAECWLGESLEVKLKAADVARVTWLVGGKGSAEVNANGNVADGLWTARATGTGDLALTAVVTFVNGRSAAATALLRVKNPWPK